MPNVVPFETLKLDGRRRGGGKRSDIEARRAARVPIPLADDDPPDCLNGEEADMYRRLARDLIDLGLLTVLDVDMLAAYVMSRFQYTLSSTCSRAAAEEGDMRTAETYARMARISLRRAEGSARALGMRTDQAGRMLIPHLGKGGL